MKLIHGDCIEELKELDDHYFEVASERIETEAASAASVI